MTRDYPYTSDDLRSIADADRKEAEPEATTTAPEARRGVWRRVREVLM